MNAKIAKKVRQEARRNWDQHIEIIKSRPFLERVGWAWHIVRGK